MINVTDPHICTSSGVVLVLAAVFFLYGHLLEFADELFGGAAIDIPVGVDDVGASRGSNFVLVLGGVFVFIVPVRTVLGGVPMLDTDLTMRGIGRRSLGAARRPLVLVAEGRLARGLVLLELVPPSLDLPLLRRGPW